MTRENKLAAVFTLSTAGNTLLVLQLLMGWGPLAVVVGYAVFCAVAFPLFRRGVAERAA